MRNINELIGIVKGINFDGVINEREVVHLQIWLNKNRNLAFEPRQAELIRLLDNVLEDKIITDYERELMLAHSEKFLSENVDETAKIYELNGIIDGIICDGKINEAEVYHLKAWMDDYGDLIKGHKPSEALCRMVENILADGIVTEEEQTELLHMISIRINGSQFETKLEYLRKQVKNRKKIGIDLIDILDDENALNVIHESAEKQLSKALFSYTGYLTDPEVVVVSLALIAMLEYDGNYYEKVRAAYANVYSSFPEQKVEGLIRSILNRYRTNNEIESSRSRIINVALTHAIVPRYFLPAFFDFIYDIYKLNFEYDLSDDLYGDFRFVYEGLRNVMLSHDDDVQVHVTQKSYKLIETTKQMIADGEALDSVIQLSIIIAKIIDKRVWNKDIKIYNPYLKAGYEDWAERLKDDFSSDYRHRTNSEFRSRWEPRFILNNDEIYLVPPIHKVKAQYNYYDIRVVVLNGEKQVYENTAPDIREIIGGYQVSVNKIKISHPLERVVYRLLAKDTILYDSGDKLHRRFMIFDNSGYEIQNNTDYKGTAIFCYQHEHDKLMPFYKNSQYKLASQNVKFSDVYVIENIVFYFSSLIKPGIFGEKYQNHFLMLGKEEGRIQVYKDIKFLVFESNNIFAKYVILINNQSYKISDFKNTVTEREGINKYVIDLNIATAGIYCVKVNEIADGKQRQIASFDFGLDPELEVNEQKLDDSTYLLTVKTDLSRIPIYIEINVNEFAEDGIPVEIDGRIYLYCIPFHFDIYRVSGTYWRPFTDSMWIGDICQDSNIDIFGTNVDGLSVYACTGELLEGEIELREKGVYRQAAVGFLISYKTVYDYVILVFTKDGKKQCEVFCYNKCIMKEEETNISYDLIKRVLSITPSYYGKGSVYFELMNQENKSIYKSRYLENGQTEEVIDVHSFEKYHIFFYESSEGLMLKNKRLIKQYDRIFYAREDFVGRSFKIKEVYFNQLVRGKFLEKSHYFNRVYVCFLNKKSKDLFQGEIYTRTFRGAYMLDRLNPVDIEICSDVIDGTMDIYITKDGDGLLLDFEHHGIKNTLDDHFATDIFLYTVDANGEKTF